MSKSRRIFISYTRADEIFKKELEAHLSPLLLLDRVSSWSDRNMHPGTLLFKEIQKNIDSADIIFLLISSDYLHSSACQGEMQAALARHEQGISITIPVIIRPCDWKILPLGDVLATPKDGSPISTSHNRDLSWLEVVGSLRELIQNWAPPGEQAEEEAPPAEPEKDPSTDVTDDSSALKWVNRKNSNEDEWRKITSSLSESIATHLEHLLPVGLQHNVRPWGAKTIVDIKNDKYSTGKRLVIEDVTGYVGYSGYQIEIYPSNIQGLNVSNATLRWATSANGKHVLSKVNGSKSFTVDNLAEEISKQIVATSWGKPAKVEPRKTLLSQAI